MTISTQVARSREGYRGIPAGLDNAVRQAEERNFHDMYIFDADAHVNELFANLRKYITDDQWKTLLQGNPDEEPLLNTVYQTFVESQPKDSYSLFDQFDNQVVVRSETTWPNQMDIPEVVDLFTRRLEDIGIKQAIVFPGASIQMATVRTRNPELEYQFLNAYTHYMLDSYLGKYNQILSPIYAPLHIHENANKIAELIDDYGGEKGICGVMFFGMTFVPMGSDEFNPIYEAAEKKGLPIILHGNNASVSPDNSTFYRHYGKGFLFKHALGFPISLIMNLTSLLIDGVPERYPNLKFAFVEGGITWISWLRQRLDDEFAKKKYEAPLLKKLPSEYMDEFYYATQPLESMHKNELEPFFKCIKNWEDHFLYSSDYPHWDFDAPSVVYDLPFLSKEAKKKIMGENARKLFRQ